MSQVSAWMVLRENNINAVVFYLKDKGALSLDNAVEFTDDLKFKYSSFPQDYKFVKNVGEKYWLNLDEYEAHLKRNNFLKLLLFLPFLLVFCVIAIAAIFIFASIFLF